MTCSCVTCREIQDLATFSFLHDASAFWFWFIPHLINNHQSSFRQAIGKKFQYHDGFVSNYYFLCMCSEPCRSKSDIFVVRTAKCAASAPTILPCTRWLLQLSWHKATWWDVDCLDLRNIVVLLCFGYFVPVSWYVALQAIACPSGHFKKSQVLC